VKTYKNLYPQVVSFENLYWAWKAAARGKRGQPDAAAFEADLAENLLQLGSELRDGAYRPGAYHSFRISDPKPRLISAAPFRDRVVHHALVRVIEPLFERRFIHDSYANRLGKGTHRPGDDLLAAQRPRGLPIGNLTSQFWANVYLNELDQFVKRSLRAAPYLRYVDDFLLFDDDKRRLWGWKRAIQGCLSRLRLTLHQRESTVYPTRNGIPFLGFRVTPTHRLLKRRNGVAFARRFRLWREALERGELTQQQLDQRVQGWVAHAAHGDTYGLRRALLSAHVLPRQGRTEVRMEVHAV